MRQKILFAGKKRSGKDTCCDYLISKLGGHKVSFAEPLYESMYRYQQASNIPEFKDRPYLKEVGGFVRDIVDPDVWINIAKRKIRNIPLDENIFICDGRYENELNQLAEMNFILVHVICPDDIRARRLDPGDDVNDKSSSENGFPLDYKFDYVIKNDGDLTSLHKQLDELLRIIGTIDNLILEGEI